MRPALVVLKLDRLGRDNIDVQQTIAMLVEKGIDIVSLDLPVRNLASTEVNASNVLGFR